MYVLVYLCFFLLSFFGTSALRPLCADRGAVARALARGCLVGLPLLCPLVLTPSRSSAVQQASAPLVYKSGKNPTPVDPSDPKKGSKKDSTFLRCLSSCKQDCQKPGEGNAKLDCVQDCQDQCCSTYEQCSFRVKTRSEEI